MRVLGNYYFFVRDQATWEHVAPSALSFCKHTNKGIDLVLWDNESAPKWSRAMRAIFEACRWRSFEVRVVQKAEGGPGVGSLTQRVQRAIWRNALERAGGFDAFFTQEDDYWYSPLWAEKIAAILAQHEDVAVVNPIDGPFLYPDSTHATWVAPLLHPTRADGEVQPTLHKDKPIWLLDRSRPARRVTFPTGDFRIRFARHLDGSTWFRTSLLATAAGRGVFDVMDRGYGGWEHYYDWCWPDFAVAEWLTDQGVAIACPYPSLHQHRTRPGKGEYCSPTFPRAHERV